MVLLGAGAGLYFTPALGVRAQSSAANPLSKAPAAILRTARTSASDLEVGGDLAGLPAGATRYITRKDLLALPQVKYTVAAGGDFAAPAEISGVSLGELARDVGAAPESDLVVAICDDKYRTNYSRAHIADHHPLLVLKINGKSPGGWPKDPEHGDDMGPYLIAYPSFTPGFRILSFAEEPQIPWGVVRIEFRDEKQVFGAIAPRGPHAGDQAVQDGYRIAEQNCYRCHNMGAEGGEKSGLPWTVLAQWASGSHVFFGAYIRDPQSKNPSAQMPGNPSYDDATLAALTAYFRTFAASTGEKP